MELFHKHNLAKSHGKQLNSPAMGNRMHAVESFVVEKTSATEEVRVKTGSGRYLSLSFLIALMCSEATVVHKFCTILRSGIGKRLQIGGTLLLTRCSHSGSDALPLQEQIVFVGMRRSALWIQVLQVPKPKKML